MSRAFISYSDGNCYYRTTLFRSQARAEAFCRMVTANATRFRNARVVASTHTTGAWFVRYQPASQARYAALYAEQIARREAKGRGEGRCYEFNLHNDTQGRADFYLCKTTEGEVYEVTSASCTCGDFHFRCQRAGIACKHQIALACAIAAGDVENLAVVRLRRQAAQSLSPVPAHNPYTVDVPTRLRVYSFCACGNRLNTAREKQGDCCTACQSVHAYDRTRAYALTEQGRAAVKTRTPLAEKFAASGLRPDLDF